MSWPLVYWIIVNWNLKDDTEECLTSVFSSNYPNSKVLVVDNGSSDGSPECLQSQFAEMESIVNPSNFGFAKANNIGILHALAHDAAYVFLLNNDTIVDQDMLSQLVQTAEGDERNGIVAPKILYYGQRDRIWHLGGRRSRWLPFARTLGHNQKDDPLLCQPFEVDYVAFCGALIKRGALQAVGLLDERFFFSYEDSDFCCRSWDAGYRIWVQPLARMWHKVSVSAQRDSVNVSYLRAKGRAMFYRLHPHGPSPRLTYTYVWASTLRTAMIDTWKGNRLGARAALRGLWDGYHEKLRIPPRCCGTEYQ